MKQLDVPHTPSRLCYEPLGLSYLQAGHTGTPIVLLHGWGAFKELWWSSLRDLGRSYRCFAPDMPGHGTSAMSGDGTMSGIADQIASFCRDLDLQQIVLVGHSMGGSVAAELVLHHPDLVRGLILVDPAVDAYRMPAYARIYLLPGVGWPALRLTQMVGRSMGLVGRHIPHEHGGGWIRPWIRRASYHALFDPEGLYRILRSLFTTRAGERLGAVRVPTLVVSGAFDGLVPPAHSRYVARHIPGAQFVQIAMALHNPMDERPVAFIQAIRPFLETLA